MIIPCRADSDKYNFQMGNLEFLALLQEGDRIVSNKEEDTWPMNTQMDTDNLIERIIDIEMKMFLEVPVLEEPSCRSNLKSMRLHRKSQFAGWSEETCRSYLQDLEKAQQEGVNLMTLKYARMADQISPLSGSPDIPFIVNQSVAWQEEIIRSCPHLMSRGRDIEDFRNYLSSELETYSDRTLQLLRQDLEGYIDSGKSMARDIYEAMAELAGYPSLEELESHSSRAL